MISCFRGKYGFLSNFYFSPFCLNKRQYPTVEHYFQSKKSLDINEQEKIRLAISPSKAKKLGKNIKLRNDWHEIKLLVMYKGVFAKFNQNENLKKKLCLTYPEMIVEENTWNDTYWGICNGIGENYLGKILMKVRNNLLN